MSRGGRQQEPVAQVGQVVGVDGLVERVGQFQRHEVDELQRRRVRRGPECA